MLDAETLRSLVSYDPDTGVFVWLKRVDSNHWNSRWAGKRAGSLGKNGYWYIDIHARTLLGHRLAWLYMTGEQPPRYIDHIDGDPSNNRWINLRETTMSQNLANSKCRKDNTSGLKGVHWQKSANAWAAKIWVNGKQIYLGLYETKEDAHRAYIIAAHEHFGEFARPARKGQTHLPEKELTN